MDIVQTTLGYGILMLAILISLAVGFGYTQDNTAFQRIVLVPAYFAGTLVACYVALVIGGGALWIISWIGILIHEILQWLVEAVFVPLRWFV